MLKLKLSKPTYKTFAISTLASLFMCGVTAQSVLADTKVADNKTIAKDAAMAAPADLDFKKLDMNSDSKLSLKEAVKDKALATSFDTTDMNKDGSISVEEYASYKAGKNMDSGASAGSSSAAPPATSTTP